MKHAFAGLVGLLLGAAAAAAVVYVNPLTMGGGETVASASGWQLGWSFSAPGLLTHTHGGRLPLARRPAGVAELWEDTIRATALTSMQMQSERDGERIWATRISVPSATTDLIIDGVVVGDHWLISMPGAGSLFVTVESNLWPAFKDTYLRVNLLNRAWQGPASYSPALAPAAARRVAGATGRFAGHRGRAVETLELGAYDAPRGVTALNGRLTLEFEGTGPFADPDAAGPRAE